MVSNAPTKILKQWKTAAARAKSHQPASSTFQVIPTLEYSHTTASTKKNMANSNGSVASSVLSENTALNMFNFDLRTGFQDGNSVGGLLHSEDSFNRSASFTVVPLRSRSDSLSSSIGLRVVSQVDPSVQGLISEASTDGLQWSNFFRNQPRNKSAASSSSTESKADPGTSQRSSPTQFLVATGPLLLKGLCPGVETKVTRRAAHPPIQVRRRLACWFSFAQGSLFCHAGPRRAA